MHPDHNTGQQRCLVLMDVLFWIDVCHIEGCKDGQATDDPEMECCGGDWKAADAGSPYVGLLPARQPQLVGRDGVVQIERRGPWGSWKQVGDLFTTLLELRWRWHFLFFVSSFLASWLFFASLWYLVLYLHGDLDHIGDPKWVPCITNVNGFYSVFLFSVESQHTIGYGYRYPHEECPEGFIVLCLQAIMGVLIQCITVSVLYAKFTRPQRRSHSIKFSKNCVICLRDNKICLLFRVANLQKSKLIGVQVSAYLLQTRYTAEGEEIPLCQTPLDIKTDEKPLVWPLTASHEIVPRSPLYELSMQQLRISQFELLVMLEATDAASGHSFQALTSYMPDQLLWGRRFTKMISYNEGRIYSDIGLFNDTYAVSMPHCSARELERKTNLESREVFLQGNLVICTASIRVDRVVGTLGPCRVDCFRVHGYGMAGGDSSVGVRLFGHVPAVRASAVPRVALRKTASSCVDLAPCSAAGSLVDIASARQVQNRSVHPDHNTGQQGCLVRMDILYVQEKLPWTEATFIGGTKCSQKAEKM
ncbi:irk-2 [Cordylochernes scorpioides]|uniref:Irk-2 n=1 Tax=Cordylochernes scorpioides TaxID=51811 RepID=A0ABY6L8G8_9ARAC|nr:irk-2 [Cordylochernes scorpioides]